MVNDNFVKEIPVVVTVKKVLTFKLDNSIDPAQLDSVSGILDADNMLDLYESIEEITGAKIVEIDESKESIECSIESMTA